MDTPYEFVENLAKQVQIPEDGILTRTLFASDGIRVVLFAFSAGQTLTEHTSPMEAVLHFLQGEAEVQLGDSRETARAGAWIRMEPNLPHSLTVHEPSIMLLTLVKGNTKTSSEPAG